MNGIFVKNFLVVPGLTCLYIHYGAVIIPEHFLFYINALIIVAFLWLTLETFRKNEFSKGYKASYMFWSACSSGIFFFALVPLMFSTLVKFDDFGILLFSAVIVISLYVIFFVIIPHIKYASRISHKIQSMQFIGSSLIYIFYFAAFQLGLLEFIATKKEILIAFIAMFALSILTVYGTAYSSMSKRYW